MSPAVTLLAPLMAVGGFHFESDALRAEIGGEVRQRLTYVRNFEFGASQTTGDWYATQRYFARFDGRLYDRLQLFVQFGSMVEIDLETGPSPIERNDFDLVQLYLRYETDVVQPWAGRRVLRLGSQRLVARREGPNVRLAFDGGGLELTFGDVRGHLLLVRPVVVTPSGIFNDFDRPDRSLWGAYFTVDPGLGSLDLYYLGFHDRDANYARGSAEEYRHSFGLRWFGDEDGWSWDNEAILQTGRFGEDPIAAWTVASTTGYRFEDLRLTPKLAVSANVASGDRGTRALTSFSALFPRGNYFSEAAVLGPRNFYNLHTFLTLFFTDDVKHTVDVNWYWRLTDRDGIYGPPGNVIRGPGGAGRLVTTAVSNVFEWTINEYLAATAIYTFQLPGPAIRSTGDDPVTHFTEFTLQGTF